MSEIVPVPDTSASDGYEPVIIGFLCNWCSYRGADLAGTSRLKYPANLRVVRVPCSGRVAPELVLRAFQEGADGVLVLACHIGECHYHEGNHRMVRRMQVLQRLIGYAGIERERLHWDYVSAAEGERFAQIVSEFSETVRGLPPLTSRLRSDDGWEISQASRPESEDSSWRMVNVSHESDHTVRGREDPRWPALREAVAEALADHAGVLALRSAHGDVAPHLFQSRDELDELALWPKYPLPAVVRRLHEADREARLAVVCRACEERGLVEMAKHRQVDWARLTLIGLACSAEEVEACRCVQPALLHAGRVVGQPAPGVARDRVLAALPERPEDRLAFWLGWVQRCIKCYACRNACPQCFCHACALEDDLWVERGRLPPPYPVFHLIKAMHMAGKCVACRECEIACPAEIPITVLYRMVSQDVEELFGYQTGTDLQVLPPILLKLEPDVET
jgi:coenzyme F420-reducing hydrogenase delta subunit/ferredoxin